MSQSDNRNTTNAKKTNATPAAHGVETLSSGETVDVLYQKMGNRWFAFSLIDDEVFVGSLSEEEINGVAENASLTHDGVTPSKSRRGTA